MKLAIEVDNSAPTNRANSVTLVVVEISSDSITTTG